MEWIKNKLQNADFASGLFLNLGIATSAEIAGRAGLDWVLIDTEHGSGDFNTMVSTIQSARLGGTSPVVRIVNNEIEHFKRALDNGAEGIMVPQINTAQEAELAVRYMKYPPDGIRGLTRTCRASGFGFEIKEYLEKANNDLLLVVQIETGTALANMDEIAAVEGVDVLFLGPSDLSCDLGIPCDLAHPQLHQAMTDICKTARLHNKKAGILIKDKSVLEQIIGMGFSLIALSTDMSIVKSGIQKIVEDFKSAEHQKTL